MLGQRESSEIQRAIRNIGYLLFLDLVLAPAGVALFIWRGFNIAHIGLLLALLHGLVIISDTVDILYRRLKVVSYQKQAISHNEKVYKTEA